MTQTTQKITCLKKVRTSGFRARLKTPGGRKVLQRRRTKGRKRLSA